MPFEGQTGTLKDGTKVVYRNGQTVPLDATGQEDYASILPGAVRLPNGNVVIKGPKGGINVLNKGGLAVPLQKEETEQLGAIQTANALSDQLQTPYEQIQQGKLQLGPVKNVLSTAKNFVGMSDEPSRNYASFRANLEKLRNDSLRLNKGVQTEGDAQRAWNELLSNINDPELVKQRITEIQAINDRAVRLQGQLLNQRRGAQGAPYVDIKQYTEGSKRKPFDLSQGQSRVNLPLGAYYRGKDGELRRNDNGDAGNPIVTPGKNAKPEKLTDAQIKEALGL